MEMSVSGGAGGTVFESGTSENVPDDSGPTFSQNKIASRSEIDLAAASPPSRTVLSGGSEPLPSEGVRVESV